MYLMTSMCGAGARRRRLIEPGKQAILFRANIRSQQFARRVFQVIQIKPDESQLRPVMGG